MEEGNNDEHDTDDGNQNGSERKHVATATGSSQKETEESFNESAEFTNFDTNASAILSPEVIQDQRIKAIEYEMREMSKQQRQRQQELRHKHADESPDMESSAKVDSGVAISNSSEDDDHARNEVKSRPYPNQMEKYWDNQFGRESETFKTPGNNFASVNSFSTLDVSMDGPDEGDVSSKQRRKKESTFSAPVAPGAYAQVGPEENNTAGSDLLDEQNATPLDTTTTSGALVHANKVDDAQAVVDATDVQRDNFKRRLLVGTILMFAVGLGVGLYFGLNSKNPRINSPDCDSICCGLSKVPIGHLSPLSCYCFGTTKLIHDDDRDGFSQDHFDKAKAYFMEFLTSEEEFLISSGLMTDTNNSFVSSAIQELEPLQGNSCHRYDQMLLMFANNVTFKTYLNKKRSSIRNSHLMLASLFIATDGINWTISEGWFDTEGDDEEESGDEIFSLCGWFGLQCLFADHVSTLNLGENNLNGTLPSEIFMFSRLQELDVSGNPALSGRIASEIGNLVELTSLSIAETNLYGTIPSRLANIPQLHELTLVGDDDPCSGFHGEIPPSLFNNSFLRFVDLSLNGLLTSLPSEIQHASNLQTLKLHYAGLIGRIPTEIERLISLKVLDLSFNLLEYGATIPSELSRLSNLEFLNIAYSGLNETIPESFCDNVNATRAHLLVATGCQYPLCSCCRNVTESIATSTGDYMIDVTCVDSHGDWDEDLTSCNDDDDGWFED